MSVDYSMSYCYGVIVDEMTADKIYEHATDDFRDDYFRPVNSWSGGDHFLGIMSWLGDDEVIWLFDNPNEPFKGMQFDPQEVQELEEKLEESGVLEFVKWDPSVYLINFCW